MKKIITLLLFFVTFDSFAQQSNKLSPAFRYIVNHPLNIETESTYPALYKQAFAKAYNKVSATWEDGYICIVYTNNADVLKEKNINVQSVLPKFVTAWITPTQLSELIEIPSVNYIDVPKIVLPNNDIAVGSTGASLLQAGKLNNTIYKGDGVIVGVFDTGIDWDHLDFRSPTDTTKSRILKLWDQTITPITGEVSPAGFNYGVEYTQAHLNNELDGTPVGYVREKDLNGHGTHVAGTAAGNGAALSTRKFAGVAPNADLVIVKGGNGSFSDYDEINAMTYFQNVANAFGKPIVINMSIGGQFGAHDGSNPDEIAVDNFCNSASGRIACISAGNDNGISIHKQVSIAANSSANVVINVPTASGSTATDVFQISLYVNDTSSVNATITLPNGSTIVANAGQSISPSVLSGAATAYFDNYIDADSKDRLINLYVVRSSVTANPSGTWTITLSNTTNKSIRIDGWLNYKGTNFGGTTVTGSDNNYLVGSPGNCTSAITVASYVGKLDWYSTSTTAAGGYQYSGSTQQDNISTFSSVGPRRDDVQKPTIAATGQAVVSCLASDAGISPSSNTVVVQGLYRAIQGTSMSSPVVTGCVALMLQTKPNATYNQIKNAITATATKDNFTGANTNYIFGAGKIDVFKAASSLTTCTTFKRETISYDSSTTSSGNTSFSLSANKAATRFTATLTGKLGGVYFKTTTSIPTNSFTIEVRSSDGTNPAGLLGSLSITPASIAKFSWNYYDVTSLNIDVTTGTDYWVVLVPASNDSWGLGYESISNSGRSKYSNGSGWTSLNGDFRIRTVVYNNNIPNTSSITNITACNSFIWNGTTYTTNGVYNKIGLVNSAGCDSTAILNLTILNVSASTTNIAACTSYNWNGTTYNTSGIYTYTTTNALGCDSIATLNLTIKQTSISTTNATICSNQLPYSWNGQSYSSAGSYVVHLTNASGCDSAATLILSVKSNYTITSNAGSNGLISPSGNTVVCSGNNQTYTITSNSGYFISDVIVDGLSQGSVNTFTFSNVTANHTISVVFSSVCQNTSSTNTITVCSSQLPYTWNGLVFNAAGSQTAHIINSAGCDSAATLNLTVNAQPSVSPIKNSSYIALTTAVMCTLQSTMNLYNTTPAGVWSSDNTNIATVSSNGVVTAISNGTANIKYSIIGLNGCSNYSNVALTVASVPMPGVIVGATNLCVGSSSLYTTATSGGLWGTLGRASINSNGMATATSAGNTSIRYTVNNAFGCSNYRDFSLTINPLPAIPSIAFAATYTGITGTGGYCKNKTFALVGSPTGGLWSSTGVFSITNAGVVTTGNVVGSGSVTYLYTNTNNCSSSRTITANVINCGSRGVLQQQDNDFDFVVYPNPSNSKFNFTVTRLAGFGKVIITDLLGKQIKTQTLSLGLNTIMIEDMAKGVYLMSVISDGRTIVKKVIVE